MMQEQSNATNELIAQMSASDVTYPSTTDLSVGIDYAAENAALQSKIDQQISDDDIQRRGVLGTILADIDDEEEVDTTTSSLLTGV
jgi:hypothetical protein